MIEYRSANEDFSLLPIVRELFREYQEGLGVDLCFQGFEEELAGLPGKYSAPNGELYVLYLNGSPVGCGALRPIGPGVAEIKRMYLRPAARGSGEGRRLLQTLIDDARRRGYSLLKLDTLARLSPAVALYRSEGFRETAPYNVNPEDDILYFEMDL